MKENKDIRHFESIYKAATKRRFRSAYVRRRDISAGKLTKNIRYIETQKLSVTLNSEDEIVRFSRGSSHQLGRLAMQCILSDDDKSGQVVNIDWLHKDQ